MTDRRPSVFSQIEGELNLMTINKLDNVIDAIDLAERNDVPLFCLNSLDEIKERLLLEYVNRHEGSVRYKMQKAMADANEDIKSKCQKLVDILKQTKILFAQFEGQGCSPTDNPDESTGIPNSKWDDEDGGFLRTTLKEEGISSNILEDLDKQIETFEDTDCRILLAGETSSGKSTLLNLLFDDNKLLPTHVKSCTSTITLIRYGRSGTAKILRSSGKEETVLLSDQEGRDKLGKAVFQDEADRVVEEDGIKEVEIFIPHPLLKGMVLIDTPGIGENEVLEEKLIHYVSNNTVHGFLYLIQTDHAGGVQEDRIVTLLRRVLQRYKWDIQHTGFSKFYPKAAMFICNRFDLVPEACRGKVSSNAISELQKCWPHLDETQVVFFSATNAKRDADIDPDYVTTSYRQVLDGIRDLYLGSMDHRMRDCFRWLKSVHRRSFHYVNTRIKGLGYSNKTLDDKSTEARARLDVLGRKADSVVQDLREKLESTANGVSKQIKEYIQQPSCKKKLIYEWSEDDFPALSQEKQQERQEWGWIKFHIDKVFYDKLANLLLDWDKETRFIFQQESDISRTIKQELNLLDFELARIESTIDGASSTCSIEACHIDLQPYESKMQFGLVASLVTKLKTTTKTDKAQQYRKDKKKTATKRAEKLYKKLLDDGKENSLLPFVHELLDRPYGFINALENQLPHFIKSNELFIEQMSSRQSKEEELKALYKDQIGNFRSIMESLTDFGDNYLFIEDFRRYQVTIRRKDPNGTTCTKAFKPTATLGDSQRLVELANAHAPRGVWTITEHGFLTTDDTNKPVTIKMYRRSAMVDNSTEEGRRLRHLIFKEMNLAEFLGTYHFDTRNSAFIFNGEVWSLTKFLHQPSVALQSKEMILVQIARGLQYLHAKGMVHMEISRDSVTVDTKGNIRLTGMCLPRKGRMPQMLAIEADNFVFLSPEVLAGDMYDSAADIYGYGLLFLDLLVFPNGVFSEEKKRSLNRFLGTPNPIEKLDLSGMQESWQNLVQKCVSVYKQERPMINYVETQVSNILPCTKSEPDNTKTGLIQDDVHAIKQLS